MSCLVIYLEGFRQVRLLEKLGDGLGWGWVGVGFLLILRIGKANQ